MSSPTTAETRFATVEETLYNLGQIDDLLNSGTGDDQTTIANYLKSDHDLKTVLKRHDAELQELCDQFIDIHVEQADNICRVYRDFSACEDQLVDFETEIVSFQRKLDEAADDVVMMQQQTDLLVRSVTNRRLVSSKINEVYDALQECDAFCEEIANKDVDANYLANLRELERKLAFLSKNKALHGSAVDNEIRPKLTAAAHKAGDKLHRFLSRKISSLADDPAHIEQNQQALEQSGQFAFSFLQSYNEPVARELVKLYVRTMADVFFKNFRNLLHDFSEASEIHAHPLDPIVSVEELTEIMSNRDSGSPQGNQVAVPPPSNFPVRTLARRDRSVSQHMRGFTDAFTATTAAAAPLRSLREATFDDTIRAVSSMGVRHGKLLADPATAAQLDQCNSWAWQFAKCIQTLANTCVAECRFIGNFFCLVDDNASDVTENFTNSERISRAVLGKALVTVETSMLEEVPMVMERAAVLATLRVIEMAKEFLCTSQDPVPLMLLSGVLEMSKASLRNNLRTALNNDRAALEYLPTVKLTPFRQAPALKANTAKVLENRGYAATLGPHPVLLRLGELLGQLEMLNHATFAGSVYSRVAEAARFTSPTGAAPSPPRPPARTAYDPHVASFIEVALKGLLAFTRLLARRHTSTLAASVFSSVNTYWVLTSWTGMATRHLSSCGGGGGGSGSPATSTTARRISGRDDDEELMLPSSSVAASASSRGTARGESGDAAVRSALSEAHLHTLEESLAAALGAWVQADAEVNNTFAFLFKFSAEVEAKLGDDFLNPGEQLPADLPPSLSVAKVFEVALEFNGEWQERLRRVVADVDWLAQATVGSVPGGRNSAMVRQRCEELAQSEVRVYLHAVADANAKLNSFATTVYGSHNDLQAKLVSNSTVIHEAQKALKS